MSAPVPVERIPVASGPIVLPKLVTGRARARAGVITGGVLLALDVALLIWAVTL